MDIPTVMQSPLTPLAILENKVIPSFSDSHGFDASGPWTNKYLIWGWLGQFGPKTRNRPLGYLHITRHPATGGQSLVLSVEQYLLLEEADHYGGSYRQKAEVECAADRYCTPRRWSWEQEFSHNGVRQPELSVKEQGTFDSGRIQRLVGGKRFDTAVSGSLALNFGLIEALQRGGEPDGEFTLYEDFSTVKKGQRFIRQEQNKQADYEYVTQVGYGLISYDFWRDAQARVVLISSTNRVYALCDDPASVVHKESETNNIYRNPSELLPPASVSKEQDQ